jgi:adenylate kinase family enzyme
MDERHKALLLLGPTGSGKTPLGEILEERGLWGRRCFHFDFGAVLREIGEQGKRPALLTAEDVDVVVRALKTGALLENHQFHIARNILLSFIQERGVCLDDLIVLNGLPRHEGQASELESILEVVCVAVLQCEPEVVLQRIRLDTGGDRAGRSDDSPADIKRKLKIFQARTVPLLDHYRQKRVRIELFDVQAGTKPDQICRWLSREA